MGCYKDENVLAIPTLEGRDPILDGPYRERNDSIQKCYQATLSRGYPAFAVQFGGECFSSTDILAIYNRYGPSTACEADGKGGGLANEVYLILEQD